MLAINYIRTSTRKRIYHFECYVWEIIYLPRMHSICNKLYYHIVNNNVKWKCVCVCVHVLAMCMFSQVVLFNVFNQIDFSRDLSCKIKLHCHLYKFFFAVVFIVCITSADNSKLMRFIPDFQWTLIKVTMKRAERIIEHRTISPHSFSQMQTAKHHVASFGIIFFKSYFLCNWFSVFHEVFTQLFRFVGFCLISVARVIRDRLFCFFLRKKNIFMKRTIISVQNKSHIWVCMCAVWRFLIVIVWKRKSLYLSSNPIRFSIMESAELLKLKKFLKHFNQSYQLCSTWALFLKSHKICRYVIKMSFY